MSDVYPYMRTLCRELGLSFTPLDVRWGLPGEDVSDPKSTTTVLNQITRGLKNRLPGAPYFLAILGNRYGHRPPMWEIPADEFKHLVKFAASWQKSLCEQWCARSLRLLAMPRRSVAFLVPSPAPLSLTSSSTSSIPARAARPRYRIETNSADPVFVLQAVAPELARAWWPQVGKPLHEAVLRAVDMAKLSKDIQADRADAYGMSLNEMEITRGILEPARAAGPIKGGALVVRRNIKRIPRTDRAGELLANFIESEEGAEAVQELRTEKASGKESNWSPFLSAAFSSRFLNICVDSPSFLFCFSAERVRC